MTDSDATHKRWPGHHFAAALAIVVIWGMNFVAMKYGLRYFTALQLGAARFILVVIPLALFIRPPKVHWRWPLVYGLLQGVGQFGLLFSALQFGMTAALASVLMQTQVFFTAVLGYFLLGEKLTGALRFGLGCAALAMACFAMTYRGDTPASSHATLAFALNLGSAAMWAASNIVARRAQRTYPNFDAVAFIVWAGFVPILPFIGLSLLIDSEESRTRWIHAPWSSWMAIAYLAWMATIIAYGLWTWLLKRHFANEVAPLSLGVPAVGISAGLLLLGESIDRWQSAGIVLVLTALASVLLGPQLAKWIRPPTATEH